MGWWELVDSPLGPVFAGGSAEGLHRIDFVTDERDLDWFLVRLEQDAGEPTEQDGEAAAEVREQLRGYFAGERFEFELPLAPRGTPFQREVWQALREIPCGETATYGEIARQLGRPGASRAVGITNSRNPLAIVVPCHRVIGSSGALTGYASGLERKRWLLEHESSAMPLFAAAGA